MSKHFSNEYVELVMEDKKQKKKEEPNKNLDLFRSNIEKHFGKNTGIFVDDPNNIQIEKFSTGSLIIDVYLKGGLPKGKISEFFGDTGSGKTSTALSSVKEHQKKYSDEIILWLDLEDSFSSDYAKAIGVDVSPNKFILSQPDTGEQAYEVMLAFTKTVGKGLIVVDSVTTLLPEKVNVGDMGDADMALSARLNSQGVRKLIPNIKKNNTTIIFLNQVRDNIGNPYVPVVTTGGKTIPFYARVRLGLSRTKGEDDTCMNMNIKTEKATFGQEKMKFSTTLIYGKGFDFLKELVDLAVESGIIQKSGSWFNCGEIKLGQGVNQVKEFMKDNEEFKQDIENKVRNHFGI